MLFGFTMQDFVVTTQSTAAIFPVWKNKRPPCWNSTSGFDFDHITVLCKSFCIRLSNFIQIGPSDHRRQSCDAISIFKMADADRGAILPGISGFGFADVLLPVFR